MDFDFFYKFKFDKIDGTEGEYAEFPFPIEVEGDIDYYVDKYLVGELSIEEEKDFYNLLLSNLENPDPEIRESAKFYADSLYKFILQSDIRLSAEDIIFIGHYTMFLNYEKMKYDEQGNIREGYEEMTIPSFRIYKKFNNNNNGRCKVGFFSGSNDKSYVGIDYNVSDCSSSEQKFSYIQAISHEMRHFQQYYEFKKRILNDHSFGYYISGLSENKEDNYWFENIEIDAEEYGDRQVIDIIDKYARDSEKEKLRQIYKKHLEYLQINKSLAYAFYRDSKVYLTDVADIMWIFKEMDDSLSFDEENEEEIESGQSTFTDFFVDELKTFGLIPDIFVFTTDKRLVLVSEQKLLDSYYSIEPDKKDIIERALKFLYSLDNDGRKKYSLDYENIISPTKIRFIKEQLDKEEQFLEDIKKIQKYPDSLIRGDRSILFSNLINDIINIRIKRIQYYEKTLKFVDKMLASRTELLINRFNDVLHELSSNDEELQNMLGEGESFNIFNSDNYFKYK